MRNCWVFVKVLTVLACTALLMTGCEDDDDPTGDSGVKGELTTVKEQTVPAAVGGMTIYLEGPTNRSTVTDDDGNFEFTGLAAGDYKLVIYIDGKRCVYSFTVPEGETVILKRIRVNEDGSITVSGTTNADIDGEWTWTQDLPARDIRGGHLTVNQDGGSISGNLDGLPFTGEVDDNEVTFNFAVITVRAFIQDANGKVSDDENSMGGTYTDGMGGGGKWSATRGYDEVR